MDEGSHKDVQHMLINPFYAISITPDLMGEHEPLPATRTSRTSLILYLHVQLPAMWF